MNWIKGDMGGKWLKLINIPTEMKLSETWAMIILAKEKVCL